MSEAIFMKFPIRYEEALAFPHDSVQSYTMIICCYSDPRTTSR